MEILGWWALPTLRGSLSSLISGLSEHGYRRDKAECCRRWGIAGATTPLVSQRAEAGHDPPRPPVSRERDPGCPARPELHPDPSASAVSPSLERNLCCLSGRGHAPDGERAQGGISASRPGPLKPACLSRSLQPGAPGSLHYPRAGVLWHPVRGG